MSHPYKDTLNLPRTDFPTQANLPAREPELLAYWQESDLYGQIQQARRDAPLYLLQDPPPFAHGDVHMGAAFDRILKDIVLKSRMMAGYRTPYVPGWDCHGLPIEYEVTGDVPWLDAIGVRRRSEQKARAAVELQRPGLQRLGIFADWEHPYLTCDLGYEIETLRAFGKLVERGLVYRSRQPVPWSTGAQTALDEAEIEDREEDAPTVHVKFPLVTGPLAGKASIVAWTAAPWTLPANQAIAVNAGFGYRAHLFRDPRTGQRETLLLANALADAFCRATGYLREESSSGLSGSFLGSEMEGWKYRHPLVARHGPVILADFITLEAGTGCVPIAPGHGREDFAAGQRYGLPVTSPVDDEGRYTDEAGVPALVGRNVFDATPEIVAALRESGALAAEGVVRRSQPRCWRSHVPIIFRALDQFFIRLDELRPEALRAIDGMQWLQDRDRRRVELAIAGRPDWCISRQRPWGVPLPAFYDRDGQPILRRDWIDATAIVFKQYGTDVWFDPHDRIVAQSLDLPPGLTRRGDTLDVWLGSGLSWRAGLERMPATDAPADLSLAAADGRLGWLQSSLLLSIALRGRAPARACLTHGLVVAAAAPPSKVPPSPERLARLPAAMQFVDRHGADIVRLWAGSVPAAGEVAFDEEMFHRTSETYRRLRTTLRVLLGNLADFDPAQHAVAPDGFTFVDRWISHRLQEVVGTCKGAYTTFEFHKVYHALNQFCAVDLRSLYLEITKDRLYCDPPDSRRRRATQTLMHAVFAALCRLLAPLCPFTAEEAWNFAGNPASVHLDRFPERQPAAVSATIAAQVDELLGYRAAISQAVEQARQRKVIDNALEAEVTLHVADDERRRALEALGGELAEFFILGDLRLAPEGPAGGSHVALRRTTFARCERCGQHRPTIGTSAAHPDLCERCADALDQAAAAAGTAGAENSA